MLAVFEVYKKIRIFFFSFNLCARPKDKFITVIESIAVSFLLTGWLGDIVSALPKDTRCVYMPMAFVVYIFCVCFYMVTNLLIIIGYIPMVPYQFTLILSCYFSYFLLYTNVKEEY